MLSPDLQKTQEYIAQFATNAQHEYVVTEHLLYGLLENDSAKQLLLSLQADLTELSKALLDFFEQYVGKKAQDKPIMTRAVERVFRRAIFQVQASQTGRLVEGADILVALMNEYESFAVSLLHQQGVTRLRLLRHLSAKKRDDTQKNDDDIHKKQQKHKKKKSALESYANNLNEKAQNNKTDPLIGRTDEVARVAQILARRRKNNPLLVGDAGVGKTAIAEGLAWLIVKGEIAEVLKPVVIYALDLAALVAGTKYRGDIEARIKDLLDELKEKPNAILFVDEIHTMVGAGASQNSNMDVSNLLKPALSSGELRCIGATTFVEYRQVFEKDGALSRRFQKVDVNEPSIADTIAILHGLKSHYEQFHNVKYDDDVIQLAVELSVKHIHGKFLPDKAIDVIDEVGAFQNLNRADGIFAKRDDTPNKKPVDRLLTDDELKSLKKISPTDNDKSTDNQSTNKTDNHPKPIAITPEMVEQVIAKIARIPPKSVSQDDTSVLKNLADNLKQVVFEQEQAVDTVVGAIKLARAGLKSENKPIGSFLLAGPTGVGKTEICRQLANLLGVPLIRFDMSEYMEAHTVSRLIGSPPGYVGFDKGGLLTEKIEQNPHCVLLLDELEKAHSDVFNLLLQVMDNGTLTDTNGRSVSFRQVILMMTSNVGAFEMGRASMGFMEQDHSQDNQKAIEQTFRPEFRNRLDAVVHFSPLQPSAMSAIVDKFLDELQRLLDDKGVLLQVDDKVRAYLAKKGYDPKMGARPMNRLIQNELKKPLAELILFGDLADNKTISVVLDDDEKLQFVPSKGKLWWVFFECYKRSVWWQFY